MARRRHYVDEAPLETCRPCPGCGTETIYLSHEGTSALCVTCGSKEPAQAPKTSSCTCADGLCDRHELGV